ncbi:hypothetical protein CR513_27079, partial [Mucuna pruriens]
MSIAIDTKKLESWERSFIAELKEMPVFRSAEIIKGQEYSTKALADLRKRKERNAQQPQPPVGVEAEAAPLSASQEEASRTPSVFELERNAPPSPHQADRESGDRPNKRPHLDVVLIDDASVSLDISAPHPSDPRPLLYKSFVRAADVECLGLAGVYGALQQYAAHGFALAHAVEKKFGDMEGERSSWAEQRKSSEEENRKLSSALVKSDLEFGNDSIQAEVKRLCEEAAEMREVHQDELKAMGESLKAAQDTIEAHDKTIY